MQQEVKMSLAPLPEKVDVCVIGGGPSGITAAIQTARAGASCLLVEKSGLLGGATVTAGVNFPGLFHAWGRQVIAGIGWELTTLAVKASGEELPDFRDDSRPHWMRQILVDRLVYAATADQLVAESGVRLLLHAMPVRAEMRAAGEWKIDIGCKEGLHTLHAKVVIDATGDANVVSMAGFKIRRCAELQPGTLIFHAQGYDFKSLDLKKITAMAEKAVREGQVLANDFGGQVQMVESLLRRHGENSIHITGIDARTSDGKTEAEVKGRAALLRLQNFFRKQPGLENFQVVYFAPECGIRETVTIDGEVEVTADDYVGGKFWEDAVCNSFYPIDIHREDGNGIDTRELKHGTVPTIPLRALLPRGSKNLLAPGRAACGDKEAHSAFRVQASCMAMGQAAGAAAALAAKTGMEIRELPLVSIHELLKAHRAIVPEKVRTGTPIN